jgi:hypothetical protein
VSYDNKADEQFPDILHEVTEAFEYTDEQFYNCGEMALYCIWLPDL